MNSAIPCIAATALNLLLYFVSISVDFRLIVANIIVRLFIRLTSIESVEVITFNLFWIRL